MKQRRLTNAARRRIRLLLARKALLRRLRARRRMLWRCTSGAGNSDPSCPTLHSLPGKRPACALSLSVGI